MTDKFSWHELDDNDKKSILEFTAKNNSRIREKVRNEFPNLYIGRSNEEVAKGWLMIAGLSSVKRFMNE
ncbi:MAG TPA: hypothetical protein PK514_06445 [Spirochaetota bacterium]|nr:hypothetical protein [Spirochaetota bacterium]